MSCVKKCESALPTFYRDGPFGRMGPLQRAAARVFLRKAKDRVREELKAHGLSLVSSEVGGPLPSAGWNDEQIDAAYLKARVEGELTDEAIIEYAESPAVGALGDGRFLEIVRNIIDWLSDPANQEKIMMVVKFIMMMLAMFGI